MHLRNHFFAIASLVLAVVFNAGSHPADVSVNGKFNVLKKRIFLAGLPAGTPILGKQTKSTSYDTTLTGLKSYSWNDSDWTLDGNVALRYDSRGRVIEWIDSGLTGEDVVTNVTYVYDDAVNRITETTHSKSLSSLPYEYLDVTEYYFGTRMAFNTAFVTGFSLSILDLGAPEMPVVDSILYKYSRLDVENGAWITSSYYMNAYHYNDTMVTVVSENRLDSTSYMGLYEYIYRFNAAGQVAALIGYATGNDGLRREITRYIYNYDNNGRIASVKITSGSNDSSGIFFDELLSITYLPSGQIGGYLATMSLAPDEDPENMGKIEFVYGSNGVAMMRNKADGGMISLTDNHGTYTITPSAGESVVEVSMFDIKGRVVGRSAFAGKLGGQCVSMQHAGTAATIGIVRVRTDRGVFNIKVNGVQ